MTDRHYTKSSRSGGSGGNCVQWAFDGSTVYLRDSKNPTGPELPMTHTQWHDFLAAAGTRSAHSWIHPHATGVTVQHHTTALDFTLDEWTAFTAAIAAGECQPTAVVV